MKDIVSANQVLMMIKAHFFSALAAFLLGTLIFLGVIANSIGAVIFSVIFTVVYFFSIYNCAYDIAQKDMKSYTEEKPYILKGLVLPVGVLFVSIVLYGLYYSAWNLSAIDGVLVGASAFINNIIFIIWTFPFNGFISLKNGFMSPAGYIIIALLPFIASEAGYFAAMKGFDISSKFMLLVYDKKKAGDKK